MADSGTHDSVHTLYRRFRPGRFSELRGQDFVVRALQGAVKGDRVVHAYLFSGPRGTGKTSTARILAKALNCAHPKDGDPCNACESCVAITQGSSLDVFELDAATNNGVDNIREIVEKAWIRSPGRNKVYIIDEIHMLSKSASAALLKTLEEPPPQVTFVLATTEPHKVPDTIQSRTQHLEFRLIPSDVLAALLADVRTKAALAVDDATLEAAVARGRGSARDALSALDQLVAAGSAVDSRPDLTNLVLGLAAGDAVATLTGFAELARTGWEAESIGEELLAELRQVFLLLVAPDVADAYGGDRERFALWGHELGLARTVRTLETVGRALREMNSAPDPTVVFEVALARLTHPELDDTLAAIEERLTRLERSGVAAAAPPPPPPTVRPIGALKRTGEARATPVAKAATPTVEVPPLDAAPPLDLATFTQRFVTEVLPAASQRAKVLFARATFTALDGSVVTVAVADDGARLNGEEIGPRVAEAISKHFGTPLRLQWEVAASPVASDLPATPDDGELSDMEIAEAATHEGASVPEVLLRDAFPDATEVE
jgi:DNA polymerase III subunit gamma/tau